MLYVLYARVCVCPALILSFPVMSLLSGGREPFPSVSTHREETGSLENWEAHCAGPGTNSEHPEFSGDQQQHSLSATNGTVSLAQSTSLNLGALQARVIALENFSKALDPTLQFNVKKSSMI